jgi:hypothetical protein
MMSEFVGKIFLWIWMSSLFLIIGPLSFILCFKIERESLRIARLTSKSRFECFLKMWVPPYSWRNSKKIEPKKYDLLGKTLMLYVILWFWPPLIIDRSLLKNNDLGDLVELSIFFMLSIYVLFALATAYRNKNLKELFFPRIFRSLDT